MIVLSAGLATGATMPFAQGQVWPWVLPSGVVVLAVFCCWEEAHPAFLEENCGAHQSELVIIGRESSGRVWRSVSRQVEVVLAPDSGDGVGVFLDLYITSSVAQYKYPDSLASCSLAAK